MYFISKKKNLILQAHIFGEAGRKDPSGWPTDGIHLLVVGDYILKNVVGEIRLQAQIERKALKFQVSLYSETLVSSSRPRTQL